MNGQEDGHHVNTGCYTNRTMERQTENELTECTELDQQTGLD